MNRGRSGGLGGVALMVSVWMLLWCGPLRSAWAAPQPTDERLAAAERFVRNSDRYLHHNALRRGMKGYGLTVLAGTKPVRFDVEIISVMTRWGPHQDVILAKLSGQNLEKTGVISGMSGSPCYIRHEGRDKLIGAVAYGWTAQIEPLCGIQPITQMLTVAGEPRRAEPRTRPAETPTTRPASGPASAPTGAHTTYGHVPSEFLAAVLDPQKRDFSRLALPTRRDFPPEGEGPRLGPLLTPLSVSGVGRRAIGRLTEAFRPLGMIPVRAGGLSPAESQAAADAKLVPGAAIAVPLVTGDADFSAVGTVTDIVNGRVLAFGHGFFADGDVSLPMGPGYIHTVMPGLFGSFKLSSTLRVTGVIDRDEAVGITGRVGPTAEMVPMTVEVRWADSPNRPPDTQSFSYGVVRYRWLTTTLAGMLTAESAWGWRYPPEQHTVRHSVEIDFGELGRYEARNVTSGMDVLGVMSDVTRPLMAMLNSSLGPPPTVKSITVKMQIERGSTEADIRRLELDGRIYRPGDTVTGKVTVRPFRKPRLQIPVRFVLPSDLPDGTYRLTATDARGAVSSLQREMPHKFAPRTMKEMLEAVQRVVEPRADRLYLRLPVKRGGVALGAKELPDLPGSRTAILLQTDKLDTRSFTSAIVRSIESRYVLSGSASAAFEVQTEPTETLIRQ